MTTLTEIIAILNATLMKIQFKFGNQNLKGILNSILNNISLYITVISVGHYDDDDYDGKFLICQQKTCSLQEPVYLYNYTFPH